MSKDVSSIKVTSEIKCIGTIEAIGSIKSNGGGWKFTAILNDPDIIADLGKGLKKVCVFSIGVSESESKHAGDDDSQGELGLGDLDENGETEE